MIYARLLELYKGYWGTFRRTKIVPRAVITAMSITVSSSGAEKRLLATGMSLSLLTEYKGNGQSNQLPTNLFAKILIMFRYFEFLVAC